MYRAYMTGLKRCAPHSQYGSMRAVDAGMYSNMPMYKPSSPTTPVSRQNDADQASRYELARTPKVASPVEEEASSRWTHHSIASIATWSRTHSLLVPSRGCEAVSPLLRKSYWTRHGRRAKWISPRRLLIHCQPS